MRAQRQPPGARSGKSGSERITDSCYIQAIGTAVPGRRLEADEAAALLTQACRSPRTARLMRRIIPLTGIRTRHLAVLEHQFDERGRHRVYLPAAEQPNGPTMGTRNALFERAAAPLVLRAVAGLSRDALAGVDTLVTCSCTHASSPGLERPILSQTPVPASADRWNLGFMGCSAGLAGVRLVHQMAARRPRALIVACELSSLHFQYSDDLDQLTANLLFADGAAAMLLGPQPSAARVVACACVALPAHAEQMVWFADDYGLRLELSQDLPDTLAGRLPEAIDRFLGERGLGRADVCHWLVHPGGPQIVDAVERALELGADRLALSRAVLRDYGNMSSPTIFFILSALLEQRVDGRCVLLAFGPGLTIEMALLDVSR